MECVLLYLIMEIGQNADTWIMIQMRLCRWIEVFVQVLRDKYHLRMN